jgi:hypothetical protein
MWQKVMASDHEASETDEFLSSGGQRKATKYGQRTLWPVTLLNLILFCFSATIASIAVSSESKLRKNEHNALVRQVDAFCECNILQCAAEPSLTSVSTYPRLCRHSIGGCQDQWKLAVYGQLNLSWPTLT